jgi:phage protein D
MEALTLNDLLDGVTPAADGQEYKTPVAMAVPKPVFVVRYGHKDITSDITPFVTGVTYTDYLSGQSDELSLELEDTDGRWLDAWYPDKGDTLSVDIGYDTAPLLPCGSFEIDEPEFSFPPSVVTIKALATGIKKSVRTRVGRAYENTTLAAIAQRIAKRNKLTLVGKIREVRIDRVTQYQERDVEFLTRLGREFGYAFKIAGTKLVFTEMADLRETEATITIERTDCTSIQLRDKLKEVYQEAKVKYQNPKTKKLVVYGAKDGEVQVVGSTTAEGKSGGRQASADTLKITARSGSKATAQVKAQAALDTANMEQTAGSIALPGDQRLVAGITINLAGFGRLSGKYLVGQARHQIGRSGGYSTTLDIKRVELPVRLGGNGAGTAAKKSSKGLAVYGMKDGQVAVVGTSQASKKK